MGLALEWLNPAGCRSLAMEILKNAKESRNEIWAHCPFHEEKTPGGAFSYNFRKDQAKCHSCGAWGDLITIYCVVFSLPEKEGFLEFKKKYGRDTPYTPGMNKPAYKKPENYYERIEERSPAPEKWKERAWSFVSHSYDRLMSSDKALNELRNRWGITERTIAEFGIGINDMDKYPPCSAWGLADEGKIWLPKGLVIPAMVGDQVRKIKVRRPDPATPWGDMRRYWEVKGGENWRFHNYVKAGTLPKVIVAVEAERDGALVYQECADICDGALGAIAGGGAAKHPCDEETLALVKRADVLLVSLDTDGPGAQNTVNFWLKEFGFAKHWPVPAKYGKDIGEAFKKGLDLREWVKAGLPGYLK